MQEMTIISTCLDMLEMMPSLVSKLKDLIVQVFCTFVFVIKNSSEEIFAVEEFCECHQGKSAAIAVFGLCETRSAFAAT